MVTIITSGNILEAVVMEKY